MCLRTNVRSKSKQIASHVKRVSQYVDMTKKLGISVQERESLVTASMMHDVGKLTSFITKSFFYCLHLIPQESGHRFTYCP